MDCSRAGKSARWRFLGVCVVVGLCCVSELPRILPSLRQLQNHVEAILIAGYARFAIAGALVAWILFFSVQEFARLSRQQEQRKRDFLTIEVLRIVICVFGVASLAKNGPLPPLNREKLALGIDQTTNLLVLLVGILVGQISGLLQKRTHISVSVNLCCLWAILLICSIASMLSPLGGFVYRYHGVARFRGIWLNPNTCGIMVGAGFLVGLSLFVYRIERAIAERARFRPTALNVGEMLLYFSGSVCSGYALAHTFSRGAWLATIVAFICIHTRYFGREMVKALAAGIVSVFLTLWALSAFRVSSGIVIDRLLTIFNSNDFSWRNRLYTWKGAMSAVVDTPFFGVGWGNVETSLSAYVPKLIDVRAIETNDFLGLAMSAGIPCLAALIGFIGLQMKSAVPAAREAYIAKISRGISVLLLVGFIFDGGLFKLALGPFFWWILSLSDSEASYPCVSRSTPEPLAGGAHDSFFWRGIFSLGVLACCISLTFVLVREILTSLTPTARNIELLHKIRILSQNESISLGRFAQNNEWDDVPLRSVLKQWELASYTRAIVRWKWSDEEFESYVLPMGVGSHKLLLLELRRPLWEYFYQQVKDLNDHEEAVKLINFEVMRVIDQREVERVFGLKASTVIYSLPEKERVSMCLVAAIRAIGIPANLKATGEVEYGTLETKNNVFRSAP